MESFFDLVAQRWPAGREDYHWLVIPEAGLAREQLTGPYRELAGRPGLAPVAPQWCHITLAHCAPVSEVSTDMIEQAAALVALACRNLAPFTVRVRRPEPWAHGVVCPVCPGAPLRELHELVSHATAQATARVAAASAPAYHPHLSLAYATGPLDSGQLRAWLCDQGLPEPAITVREIALVREKHDGQHITWQPLRAVRLGAVR